MLNVGGAGLSVCLLYFAGLRAQSYLRRVVFVALLGILASIVGPLTEWHASINRTFLISLAMLELVLESQALALPSHN